MRVSTGENTQGINTEISKKYVYVRLYLHIKFKIGGSLQILTIFIIIFVHCKIIIDIWFVSKMYII